MKLCLLERCRYFSYVSTQIATTKMTQVKHLYDKFSSEFSKWLAEGIFQCIVDEDTIISMLEKISTKEDLNGLLIIATFKSNNNDKVIMKLLEKGADKETMSITGATPIMYLAERDNLKMFRHFIKIGTNMFSYRDNSKQQTTYTFCIRKNVSEYIQKSIVITEKDFLEAEAKERNALLEENKKLQDIISKMDSEIANLKGSLTASIASSNYRLEKIKN